MPTSGRSPGLSPACADSEPTCRTVAFLLESRMRCLEGVATVLAVWDGEQAYELAYNVKKGSWILSVQSIAA